MKYRKLRIAWSVVWTIAAVLLCVLWARSYSWIDVVEVRKPFPPSAIGSGFGIVLARAYREPESSHWSHSTYSTRNQERMPTTLGFSVEPSAFELVITAPYWFVLGLTGIIAAFGCPPWRFSLRTLLIATTLVAVGLGLIVWSSNR
jgi:hypothetical protein